MIKNITLKLNDDGYGELTFDHALPETPDESRSLMQEILKINEELHLRFGIIKYLVRTNLDSEQTEKYIDRVYRQARVMVYDKVAFYGFSDENLTKFKQAISGIKDHRKLAAFTTKDEALAWLQKHISLID